jgi:NAD(P)-dependent dehydrogenase (short-subunit alcohol dehydrogenase family)
MDLGLQNKVIVITGGSDGLGAAAARACASEGANVVIAARGLEKLTSVASEIGGQALAVQTDVTNALHLENLVQQTLARFGRIDALVNNAGRSAAKPFEGISDLEWGEDLDLKFYAAIRLSRLVAPHLRTAGGGSIVNVLATGGKTPGAGSMPSTVSRAAGMALMKAMSKDLGKDNIRVNGVLIGLVESDQWVRRAQASGKTVEQIYQELPVQNNIPLGRVGRAGEFGDFIAFMVSARAAYLSGCAINFDGGMSPAV